MPFMVAQYIFQRLVVTADDQMNVIGHDAPGVHLESFFCHAMLQAVRNDLFVFVSCEQVNPGYGDIGYKMQLGFVAKPVFAAHVLYVPRQVPICKPKPAQERHRTRARLHSCASGGELAKEETIRTRKIRL
jgi:hypothetical protein